VSVGATLSYFLRSAMGGMVRSPFVHVIAVAALALSLFGFGVARVAGTQVDALVASLGGDVELTVYLADGAPPEQVEGLQKALEQRTAGTARRVSPAEALGRLAAQLGDDGKALTELEQNPLPWSLELKLPPQARDAAQLKATAQQTRALPFVSGVDYGEEALERLTLISQALRVGALIAFSLVFLTTVIIVSATLQLAIFSRREEIEIQKLVGGTDRFVRLPFLIEGVVQGVLGGALAFVATFAAVRFLESDRAQALAFLRLGEGFRVDWARLGLEQVGFGLALGFCGSFIAVRRFLRV
jgi:cell division transport system permease protein